MIYVTSDLHFNHKNIINLCYRPFKSVEEMNEMLIENWNKTVKYDDEVYILGDIGLSNNADEIQKYLLQLNGKKHLIIGNHDQFVNSIHFKPNIFSFVGPYKELRYNGEIFIMMHYPILDWNMKDRKNSFMLHGHQHNDANYNEENIKNNLRRYDVGVDANNYTPVSLDEIITKYKQK